MKNIENIKRVLKKIEENPECWRQEKWHCGTVHCFAGHAQREAGKNIDDGTTRRDARIFFGFTQREADYYFNSERTLKELKTATKDFYNVDGYSISGRDRNGFDRNGYDIDGRDLNGRDRYGYDINGRDRNGYDRYGYDINGRDRNGYARDGRDRDGFDYGGFDRDGYSRDGFDRDHLDKDNNPKPE